MSCCTEARENVSNRCIIVAAASFDAEAFAAVRRPDDLIVAADGGFASLASVGVVPDAAIGDFDSLGHVPDCPVVLKHPCEKDDSDLALALNWSFDRGCAEVLVFGALGGRLDQTVATLQTLHAESKRGTRVVAVGEGCVLVVLVAGDGLADHLGELRLPAGLRGTVSVFSLCDVSRGVTETGLQYGLEDADLPNTTSLGLSNELIGEEACIRVRDGALAVFLPRGVAQQL